MRTLAVTMAVLALVASAPFAEAEELEVLHYWTSGGESKAVNVLKEELEKKGHQWKDSAIAGGGGQNAMTVLKTRVVAGTPFSPTVISAVPTPLRRNSSAASRASSIDLTATPVSSAASLSFGVT